MTNRFLLGVLLAIISVVGYVALAYSGVEQLEAARGIFFFTTPFIAILLGQNIMERIERKTEATLDQTNGALTRKINNAMDEAAHRAVQQAIDAPELPTVNAPKKKGAHPGIGG